ncbi:MAG: hypothetical protein WAU57_00365 [Xanthobacteraceae bacterium]
MATPLGTVILFSDTDQRPRSEVALGNGDHILLELDRTGLTIKQIKGDKYPRTLFQGDPALVSQLCAGLVESPGTIDATPLRILVAAAVHLGSADEVKRAFHDAAAQVGKSG